MKKPWQIWLVFSLCLIAITIAMTWLSVTTVRLDALRETDRVETELARREAELQERISSALYRMDLMMLPIVAQEAGRPYYLYESFYHAFNPAAPLSVPVVPGSGSVSSDDLVPSPLLFELPKFVFVHFEIGPGSKMTSPQRPTDATSRTAIENYGIDRSAIEAIGAKLGLASQFCDYDSLLSEFPPVDTGVVSDVSAVSRNAALAQNSYYVPEVEKIREMNRMNQSARDGIASSQEGNKFDIQRSRGAGRTNEEFNRRSDTTQELSQQPWANNLFSNQIPLGNYSPQTMAQIDLSKPGIVRQGVMQAMWIEGHLVLARRVDGKSNPVIQCCWLDWEAIQIALKERVEDLLPQLEFQPLNANANAEVEIGNALTTIPVRLVLDTPYLLATLAIGSGSAENQTSGWRLSLWLAWCGFGVAAIASGLLLWGVMRLSERRATFVSAVTHELRTPLTTFRMYAEMMAEGMVPEDKIPEYAATLKVQADRLSHLVENVLRFAKLERGATSTSRNETVTVGELLDRFSSRLVERAHEAGMSLSIEIDDSISKSEIATQPMLVEQILFNLVDNACKYAQGSVNDRIEITCYQQRDKLQFRVRDHGPGVDRKYRNRMFQPFCKSDLEAANTAPGVGLGLALCQRMARSLGGRLFYEERSVGATFVLELPL